MTLSPNQLIVIKETVQREGRSAHSKCRTMKALEKKGLVVCMDKSLGTWKPTEKAISVYSNLDN